MNIRYSLFLFLLLCSFGSKTATGQLLHTPANLALGGGGTAYTTGYEALFINPANLYIRERLYRWQFSTLNAGFSLHHPAKTVDLPSFQRRYLTGSNLFWPPSSDRQNADYETILQRNYPGGRQMSDHPSEGEIHWFGVQSVRDHRSYALGIRTRYGNRYEVGRGFYDRTPDEQENTHTLDRSLNHRFQILHDISFGYAESFEFLEGLVPQLSQIVVGIAPKIVIGGSYMNTEVSDVYKRHSSEPAYHRTVSASHYSAGLFTDAAAQGFISEPGLPFKTRPDRNEFFSPAGWGVGLDMGLSWLMTLGDDLSFARQEDHLTRRSLRISFSLTDIGFVRYDSNTATYIMSPEGMIGDPLPRRADYLFEGRPGEHVTFLQESDNPPLDARPAGRDPFSVSLPSSFQAGMLLQLQRLKVMADLKFGLTDDAFQSTNMTSYLGLEVKPIRWLPVRFGTRLAPNLPNIYSTGIGIETGHLDLGIGIQLRSRSPEPTSELVAGSFGSVTIYLP